MHFLKLREYHSMYALKNLLDVRVEKSLDLIPSTSNSVKIQIMGGNVCLRCKSKTILMFVDIIQQCFALLPQVNFTANNLNFN